VRPVTPAGISSRPTPEKVFEITIWRYEEAGKK
jgi:hypothetical protein